VYRQKDDQPELKDFYLPFGGHLDAKNRWVRYAAIVPWKRIETAYAKLFSEDGMGAPAKSARIALGAILIKEKLDITDEETREQIRENPYLQYFIGFEGYRTEAPFDASMMVHFRKRFGVEELRMINEWIHEETVKKEKDDGKDGTRGAAGSENKGKLIIDATCVPQDIQYPTDVRLLNEVREKTEGIIDRLHAPYRGRRKKPRTYRKKARKAYLEFCKKRRPKEKDVRRAKREQLGYVRRNLLSINKIIESSPLSKLSRRERRNLMVGHEIYRQQTEMYRERKHAISGRIVSVSQPHVRPIVRGKAAAEVEFGAKVSVSLVNGFTFVDRISWEPYNESVCFIEQVEEFRKRFGCYPESVHVDKIYRTRGNRTYCQEHAIRMSGPKLGRRLIPNDENRGILKNQRRVERMDEGIRNAVEGKFGQGKRRFGLGKIFEKLIETSETAIMLGFLVMNLEKIFKDLIFAFFICYRRAVRYLTYRYYCVVKGCF
jgi:IS5 family transposase